MVDCHRLGRRIGQSGLRWLRKAVAWRHRLPWSGESSLQKYDIINTLARRRGYRAYLEICTTSTGGRFGNIDRRQFQQRHRLMYRCPQEFADGEEITFRTTGESLRGLIDPAARYDIMLIDPWHTFEASIEALELGFSLLREDGVMVVHDCSPPLQEMATPSYRSGPWCGVTYLAFLEFVFSRGLRYCTVDTDYGCGVVQRDQKTQLAAKPVHALRQYWHDLYDRADPFAFFSRHRRELLNLVSAEDFLLAEGLRAPLPVRCASVFRRITHSARRALIGSGLPSGDLEVVTSVRNPRVLEKVGTKLGD